MVMSRVKARVKSLLIAGISQDDAGWRDCSAASELAESVTIRAWLSELWSRCRKTRRIAYSSVVKTETVRGRLKLWHDPMPVYAHPAPSDPLEPSV